jgi:hypothetical protein
MSLLQTLLEHVTRLTESMQNLKARVQDAVAQEVSRIVSETVQEVLQSLLRRRSSPQPQWSSQDSWDEDETDTSTVMPLVEAQPAGTWKNLTSYLISWWFTRSTRSWWPAIALAGVGLAACTQQPLVWAAMAAAQAASELLSP